MGIYIYLKYINIKLLKKSLIKLSNCWAYTAVAAVQGAIFKFYGNKIERLSIQQLTDCSSDSSGLNYYGNSGCDGGNVWNGLL